MLQAGPSPGPCPAHGWRVAGVVPALSAGRPPDGPADVWVPNTRVGALTWGYSMASLRGLIVLGKPWRRPSSTWSSVSCLPGTLSWPEAMQPRPPRSCCCATRTTLHRQVTPHVGRGRRGPTGQAGVLRDRAKQARVANALEPEWEARFEPRSYGFRRGRGCHDAIEAIYWTLRGRRSFANNGVDVVERQVRHPLENYEPPTCVTTDSAYRASATTIRLRS